MTNEFNALLKNQNWTFVAHSQHQHIVDCKWVFEVKRLALGLLNATKLVEWLRVFINSRVLTMMRHLAL